MGRVEDSLLGGKRRFVRASSSIVTSRTVVRPQRSLSSVGQIFKCVKKKKKKCVFLNVYEINIGGGGELLMDKNDRIARFEIVEK